MPGLTQETIAERDAAFAEFIPGYENHGIKTIARGLLKKHPSLWPSLHSAEKYVRRLLVEDVEKSRKNQIMKRPKRTAGELMKLPKSKAKPYTAHHIRGENKFLVISDLHIPYHNEKAIEIALQQGKKEGVNYIILLGDVADFYQISRWPKSGRKANFLKELEAVKQFFAYLRNLFPNAKIIWKEGNHEERYPLYMFQNAPIIAEIHSDPYEHLKCGNFGIEIIKEKRPINISTLMLFHGHELPRGLATPVNQARGQWLRTTWNTVAGHGHRTSTHVERGVNGAVYSNWSIGCLCDLAPEFARVNKWNHGFGILYQEGPKSFHFKNYMIHDGKLFGDSSK